MRRGILRKGGGVKLKGLMIVRKPSGAEFVYYRAKGRELVRLPDLPFDHPDFLRAYADARKNAPPKKRKSQAPTGSIAAAIEAYLASDRFLALRASTRDQRRRIFDRIRADVGRAMIRDLAPRHIRADLANLSAHAANNRLKCWRALCSWAVEAGLIAENPAASVTRHKTASTQGHLPWTQDDIDAFRDHWPIGSRQRLAFELLHWTAARMSDAVRLGPGMIDRNGWLVYHQTKTGGEVAIPFRRALPEWAAHMQSDLEQLHAALDACPSGAMTFMVTEAGAARSIKAASAWFAAAARAAGLDGKSAHGLRKTRAQLLAEAGASAHQIAAWTGHESLAEVQHYARNADRRRILSGPEDEQKVQTISASLHFSGKNHR